VVNPETQTLQYLVVRTFYSMLHFVTYHMLQLWDALLTLLHLSIIIFNLFGWIPKRTRIAHIVSISLTAASWFILGIWYGTGYCPITDWQWKVKTQLGESDLPGNFVEYYLEKITGHDFSSSLVNTIITVCFCLAVLMMAYVNFILPYFKIRAKKKKFNINK
jgi:hypothetical protein